MANRRPRHVTGLMVPRQTAVDYLIERIEAGNQLVKPMFGPDKVDHDNWLIHIRHLLRYLFDTDEYANEWAKARPVPSKDEVVSLLDMRRQYGEAVRFDIKWMRALIQRLRYVPNAAKPISEGVGKSQPVSQGGQQTNRVFVVHGHDRELLATVEAFLRRLGLNPVILQDRPGASKTIIEKFENYSDVLFAIALLTPDDIGYPIAEERKTDEARVKEKRARQNVYLELGFFLGRLGRDKVVALYRKPVLTPSDYAGIQLISVDDGDWQLHLARELSHAGVPYDPKLLLG